MKMRKWLLSFILMALSAALLLSGLVMAQEGVGLPITFVKYFTGTIDGKYPIEMVLSRSGSRLSGRYYYVSQGVDLKLNGHIDAAGNVFLEERGPDYQPTGLFRGKFVTGSRVEGKWIRPDGTQSMGFVLEENFAPSSRWDEWRKENEILPPFPKEIFLLGMIDGTQPIHMQLSIQNGNVMGSYYYDNRETDIPVTGTAKGWRLLLTEYGEPGKVTGRIEAGFGTVNTEIKGYWISPDGSKLLPLYMEIQKPAVASKQRLQSKDFSLKQIGIFSSEQEEQAFIKMVGPEVYYDFLLSFMMSDHQKDRDNVGAHVHRGYIPGLGPEMGGMIMVTPDGKIWAGYWYWGRLFYYTNVPEYATRLPETMKAWKEKSEIKEVFYMSAGIQ